MNSEERDVEFMLRDRAPRPEPPAEVRARVLAAAEQEWQRHRRRRWYLPAALAALVVLAAGLGLLATLPPPGVTVQIAATDGLWIEGERRAAGGASIEIPPGADLRADAATRLLTSDGTDLRLRAATRLRWLDTATIELVGGSVYIDTGGRSHMRVRTPMGEVSDIGTRFMVTLDERAIEVAMRDGKTSIATDHGTYTAAADGRLGDVVTVSPSRIASRAEPISAERWSWIYDVHSDYQQREVLPLLRAIAADLGCTLQFASPAVEASALQLRLQGELTGLGPEQALDVVLGTTGLRREPAADGILLVGFESPTQ